LIEEDEANHWIRTKEPTKSLIDPDLLNNLPKRKHSALEGKYRGKLASRKELFSQNDEEEQDSEGSVDYEEILAQLPENQRNIVEKKMDDLLGGLEIDEDDEDDDEEDDLDQNENSDQSGESSENESNSHSPEKTIGEIHSVGQIHELFSILFKNTKSL
jgi:hypothetical protein